ncbi:MAG TPA: AraC family transcriptional regulator [Candidatus Eisenbergiella merdavium]|uniref:AraC family transcriptional regulator n=1 Tax=Candidatus Eisenbergiella merdavium TaxID=2838551 RepID=A0A9D2SRX9_9FIRM|nr:AraC family transcriptional regulator [Candidatus Eisenbergiella merdavium]
MLPSILLNDDRSERVRYDHPDYPLYIRRALLSGYPEYQAPNHWHEDIELICVLSGQMEYNVNGEIFVLNDGEGIFVNSGQMHFGFSEKRKECDFLCILLHPLFLCSVLPFERDFLSPLTGNAALPCLMLRPGEKWQAGILSQLRLLYEHRENPTSPLRALSSFSMICSLLYEHAPAEPERENGRNRDLLILKNMAGFIQQKYMEKISLAQIASAGAVGESKCCRLFSRYFAQSPNEYLNRYRLNKSVDLLCNTDLSITEIALSSGFGSASYYAELFRKWMNQPPTGFRRQRKEGKNQGYAV